MMARARPGADPVKARAADPEYVQVESFLGAISQRRLASASFRCGAYARSLLHWEKHLTNAHGPAELQASLFTLQRVCGALQEEASVDSLTLLSKCHL